MRRHADARNPECEACQRVFGTRDELARHKVIHHPPAAAEGRVPPEPEAEVAADPQPDLQADAPMEPQPEPRPEPQAEPRVEPRPLYSLTHKTNACICIDRHVHSIPLPTIPPGLYTVDRQDSILVTMDLAIYLGVLMQQYKPLLRALYNKYWC
jgi:hypothetical protein